MKYKKGDKVKVLPYEKIPEKVQRLFGWNNEMTELCGGIFTISDCNSEIRNGKIEYYYFFKEASWIWSEHCLVPIRPEGFEDDFIHVLQGGDICVE